MSTKVCCLCLGAVLLAVALSSVGFVEKAGAASPCVGEPTQSSDGTTVYGSGCADRIVVVSPHVRRVFAGGGRDVIYVNPNVTFVDGGEGDDVIYGELSETEGVAGAAPPSPTYVPSEVPGSSHYRRQSTIQGSGFGTVLLKKECSANVSCYGGDGSQELVGSGGNDRIFGQRGNDVLKGLAGNDMLFGGVGDESEIAGNAGSDLLSGGLGTDVLDGGGEDDLVRGDGTIDELVDSGGSSGDTMSFATAVAPGFHGSVGIEGFPTDSESEERGVYVRLDGGTGLCGTDSAGQPLQACNNDARYGGGSDHVGSGFENVIGSPYADYIVGSTAANRIYGGGGADVIYGNSGSDTLLGGPDGDFLDGQSETDAVDGQGGTDNCAGETQVKCEGGAVAVDQRERQYISVGFMETVGFSEGSLPLNYNELFLTGSTGADNVKMSATTINGTGFVTFATEAGSAPFDTSGDAASTNCEYSTTVVKCGLPAPLDAITVAGMGGNDNLTLQEGFVDTTSPILLGGEGNDVLTTNNGTEDMLVDGNGAFNDTLRAWNYDDALIENEGKDTLEGGRGNDLLLNAANCDGDLLDGARQGEDDGEAVNSTSWAKLPVAEGSPGVLANLEAHTAGNVAGPSCSSGETSALAHVDDLEGSSGADKLVGDGASNNLLGRLSNDELLGQGGADTIEAAEEKAAVDADKVFGGNPTTSPGDWCRYDLGMDVLSGCESKVGV
jgi:Ca2+-binding RTX toxin-like protein